MAETTGVLSESLFQALQAQKLVLLSTVDADTGAPQQHAISWIYAVDANTLRFAVDTRSRIVSNIVRNADVAISVFAAGSLFSVMGQAHVVLDLLPEVPLKLTCLDVRVQSVKDIMYYGSRISSEPVCEKTYDERAAHKLDAQVFESMKKA